MLHGRAAQAIEELFAERLPEHYYALAHHYSRSGNIHQGGGLPATRRATGGGALGLCRGGQPLDHRLRPAHHPARDAASAASRSWVVQMTLGVALRVTKGQAAPEVERLYTHARELCEQVGEPPQLFRVLWGLWQVYGTRGNIRRCGRWGSNSLAWPSACTTRTCCSRPTTPCGRPCSLAVSSSPPGHIWNRGGSSMIRSGTAPMPRSTAGMTPGCVAACAAPSLWLLGYPDQAVASIQAALALAQQLAHPLSLTMALHWAAVLHHLRREVSLTQARAEAAMTIATDQGFPAQTSRRPCPCGAGHWP